MVSPAVDWKVGDQIVIGPTEYTADQHEQREITNITTDNDKNITFITINPPLNYFHYGSNRVTVTSTNLVESWTKTNNSEVDQTVDMRATVALLNRAIVIEGEDTDDWRGTIYST